MVFLGEFTDSVKQKIVSSVGGMFSRLLKVASSFRCTLWCGQTINAWCVVSLYDHGSYDSDGSV